MKTTSGQTSQRTGRQRWEDRRVGHERVRLKGMGDGDLKVWEDLFPLGT